MACALLLAPLLTLGTSGCAHLARPRPGTSAEPRDLRKAGARNDSAAGVGPGQRSHTRNGAPGGAGALPPLTYADSIRLPAGSAIVRVENLDGIILIPATMAGLSGRDTSGWVVLDTGAGSLAVDFALARALGLADAETLASPVEVTSRPLSSLRIGRREMGPVAPLLAVNMSPVRGATDHRPLGLLGQAPLARRALLLDLDSRRLAILPPADSALADTATDPIAASRARFGGLLTARARPVPFRLAADGKMLVRARLVPPGQATANPPAYDSLTLIVDTGATKSVLFEDAIASMISDVEGWPALRGLWAPTLFGAAPARVVLLPELAVGADSAEVAHARVDVLVTGGAMAEALERAVGEPVHGLLGYSFLRYYRIAIDYPGRQLWLEPRVLVEEERPFEYSQPGLQIERTGSIVTVSGVVEGSPAARAGIGTGDEILRIGNRSAAQTSVLDLARALEGPPGTRVRIELRRGARERTLSLLRRQLL